jgi:hypothetical protein
MAILTFLITYCNVKMKKKTSAGLVAGIAVALYFQGVLYPFKLVRPAELILDRLKPLRKYLDDLSASHADQVVMVFMTEGMLIMGMFVVSLHLLDKAAFQKEGNGSVDRSLGNPDAFALHAPEEFFRGKVTVQGEDLVQDSLSFLGELKASLVEKFSEYLFLHMHILMKTERGFQFFIGWLSACK